MYGILEKIRRYNEGDLKVFTSMVPGRKASTSSSRSSTLDSVMPTSPEESSPLKETLEGDAIDAVKAFEYYRTCPVAGHVESYG